MTSKTLRATVTRYQLLNHTADRAEYRTKNQAKSTTNNT